MAAHLYSGVKSLHLVLDTPYDTVRTTDIRDDLVSVKVWYSTTTGFDPGNNQGTLIYNGSGLSITITELTPGTRYYVRYAFISAIDPNVYTISSELNQIVYSDSTTVSGYLTNDPTPIATAMDGSGGDFSIATGIFKVYNGAEDVSGLGPVYAIKPNTTTNLTGATINATTGVYSCTGLSANSGNVTFTATFGGTVLEEVWNVYKAQAGQTAPMLNLTATANQFAYKDQYSTTSSSSQIVITANLTNLTGTPTFTVTGFTRAGVSLGAVSFTQNNNTITITPAQFDAKGVTIGSARVTATLGTTTDVLSVFRTNDGTEQLTAVSSNENHSIPATTAGGTVTASYIGSGTILRVLQGIVYLPVDNTSPFANGTWRVISTNAVGITVDTTPQIGSNFIYYDTHAAMTADVATIDYTIRVTTTSGITTDIITTQSFTKAKQGVAGSSARAVDISATGQAFITAKNSTTISPNTVVLTATQSNFTTPAYTWLVDGIAPDAAIGTASGNTFILNSFAAGSTKVITVTASEGTDTAFDTFSVYSIKEGDDAFIVGLSNENQTISCDSTGTVITGQFPFTSKMSAILGGRLLDNTTNPQATFAKISYTGGDAGSYNIDPTGLVTINSLSNAFAEAVFSATVNGVTQRKTLSLNKSVDGNPGSNVVLTATNQGFTIAKNTGVVSPTSITFNASPFNLGASPAYVWKVSTDGGTNFTTQTGQTSATFTLPSFSSGSKLVRLEASGFDRTVADQITIYTLKEGDDSLVASLINENQTITCDSTGTPVGGQFPLSSELAIYRGIIKLTNADGVTWSKVSETGMTSSIVSTTGVISVTAISADSGTATYRATIGTTTLDKIFTLNKSKNGTNGTNGTNGSNGTNARSVDLTTTTQSFLYNTAGTSPSPSSVVVTATAQNTSGTVFYEFLVGGTSVQNTTTNTYSYTPQSAFGSMPQQIIVRIREGSSTSTVLATDILSMIAIKPGTDGINSVSAVLSNEAATVSSDSAGNVGSFSNAGGTFYVFDGTTDKTGNAAVTYSVASSTGVTISIASSGVYTITAMSADSGTATLRAVYNNLTINKIYSISKSRAGATGPTGPAGTNGTNGTTPNKFSTAYLYQWSPASTIGAPSGSSTYTWLTGVSSGYTGGNSWQNTPPTNPGTSGIKLWVASKAVSDVPSATSTSVDWSTGATTYVAGQNGEAVSGVSSAKPEVYQWALSTPTISGSTTYTWSNGNYAAPSGWTKTSTTPPSTGYYLYSAIATVTDSATATSTTINWGTASIVVSGYAGTNGSNGSNGTNGSNGAPGATGATGATGAQGPQGPQGPQGAQGPAGTGTAGASATIMYARIANNPAAVSGNVSVGGNNRPSGGQAAAVWGGSFNVAWYATDPDPNSNASLYVADGIYNGSTTTVWSTPYIASLKVGSLSAITTNTGNLTVSDYIRANNAAISGTSMSGSGGILYSTGLFALGNSTTNITYNGDKLSFNGNVVGIDNLNPGAALPNYVRTYKGNVTPNVNVSSLAAGGWMPLQMDASALTNKLGAWDADAYRTVLPAGTYFYELTVPVKCQGSDTNDACYTAIVENPPGTPSGSYQQIPVYDYYGNIAYYETVYSPGAYTVISTCGVNVIGDWQTASIVGVGKFTLTSSKYISPAILTTDGGPRLNVVARSGFCTLVWRIYKADA
jgi:hypothetical protein